MRSKVLEAIRKFNLVENGETVIAGISGGPDSVCLLHILTSLIDELNIKIHAVHINHMLRGTESQLDEEFVKEYCLKLDVPLHMVKCDIKAVSREKGISLEEAGREERYRYFEIFANNTGATKIAVAHNKNDQAETILMHIIRGAGLDGLIGMNYRRGMIIRPLLDVKRDEIEEYCKSNGLNPRIDSTNFKNIYTRNKIRLDLIPFIEKISDCDIIENICRMGRLLKDDHDFIKNTAEGLFEQCIVKREKTEIWLNISNIKEYHPAIMKRVVRSAISEVKGNLAGIEDTHVEAVADLGLNGRTGCTVHLPCGIRSSKSYEILKIYLHKEDILLPDFCFEMKIPGVTRVAALKAFSGNPGGNPGGGSDECKGVALLRPDQVSVTASVEECESDIKEHYYRKDDSPEQFFDYEKVKEGISIRNRRNGDVFKPLGSTGTKKLKEYLIDKKIPHEFRNEIPLIVKDKEIVWIIGYKISDKFKVTENTKIVLKLIYD